MKTIWPVDGSGEESLLKNKLRENWVSSLEKKKIRYGTAMYPFLKVSDHEFSWVNQFE